MNDINAPSSKLNCFSALTVRGSKFGCLALCLSALTTTGVLQLPPPISPPSLCFWSPEFHPHNLLAFPVVMECVLVETMQYEEEAVHSKEKPKLRDCAVPNWMNKMVDFHSYSYLSYVPFPSKECRLVYWFHPTPFSCSHAKIMWSMLVTEQLIG